MYGLVKATIPVSTAGGTIIPYHQHSGGIIVEVVSR